MSTRAIAILGGALLGVGCMTGLGAPGDKGSGAEPLESRTAALSFTAASMSSPVAVTAVATFDDSPPPRVFPTVQARAARIAANAAAGAAVAAAAPTTSTTTAGR